MLASQTSKTLEHDWRILSRSVERAYQACNLSRAEDSCWESVAKAKLMGEFEPRLAISLSNLAVIQRLRGQTDRAEDLSNLALRILQAVDRRSPLMAKALLNAAAFFYDEGRLGEARRLYGKAIALLEEGYYQEDLCAALCLYARLCCDQNRDVQAETLLKRVVSLEPQRVETLILYHLTWAMLGLRTDRLSRSDTALAEAAKFLDEGPELSDVWESSLMALRGDVLSLQHKAARAVAGADSDHFMEQRKLVFADYHGSLELRERSFGPFHHSCGSLHRRLGLFHLEIGEYDQAEQCLRKALTIGLSARGPYHQDTLECLEVSAQVLRLLSRHEEAEEIEMRAGQVERKVRERARETYVAWGEPDN